MDHVSPAQGGSTRNLTLIGQAVSEKMFENNGSYTVHVICIYNMYIAPGQGQGHTTSWGQILFINITRGPMVL